MPKVRPGWYVLAAVTLYAVVITVILVARQAPDVVTDGARRSPVATARNDELNEDLEASAGPAAGPAEGGSERSGAGAAGALHLWYPIPGARLPRTDSNLPGSPRAYRDGVSQGFDFHDGDVGVPAPYGAAVIAAADAQVIRADLAYVELEDEVWQLLLDDVADGATAEELDDLRGRQVWLRLPDGTVLRYGHLAGLASGLSVGQSVYRGQVIGYVGNSGTDDGVTGNRDGARLRFEIWQDDDDFFGEDTSAQEVRLAAASLFVGP